MVYFITKLIRMTWHALLCVFQAFFFPLDNNGLIIIIHFLLPFIVIHKFNFPVLSTWLFLKSSVLLAYVSKGKYTCTNGQIKLKRRVVPKSGKRERPLNSFKFQIRALCKHFNCNLCMRKQNKLFCSSYLEKWQSKKKNRQVLKGLI